MATLEQLVGALRQADSSGEYEDAKRIAQLIKQQQTQAAPPTEQGGFFSSLKKGASTLGELPAALQFGTASPEQAAARREALVKANEPTDATTRFADIKDVGSAIDWAKQTTGGSLGSIVAPAAGSLGALLMKGPGAAKVVGAGLLGAQYLTENLGRQAGEQTQAIKEGEAYTPTSLAKAGVGAAGQTTLDVVGFKFLSPVLKSFPVVGRLFGEAGEKASIATADQLADAFKKGTLTYTNGVAKGIGLGVVVEIPQEIAQQALERWQAGLSLTDEKARGEYLEAAAGAVLLGGGIGGMGGALNTRSKRAEAQSIIEAREVADRVKNAPVEAPEAAAPKVAVPPKVAPEVDLVSGFTAGEEELGIDGGNKAGLNPTYDSPDPLTNSIIDSLANTGSTKNTAEALGIERSIVKKVQADHGIPSKGWVKGRDHAKALAEFNLFSEARKAHIASRIDTVEKFNQAEAAAAVDSAAVDPAAVDPAAVDPAAKAIEEARLKAEADAKLKAEADAKLKAEADAKLKAAAVDPAAVVPTEAAAVTPATITEEAQRAISLDWDFDSLEITDGLRKIAVENGIEIKPADTAQDVIAALRAKAAAPAPAVDPAAVDPKLTDAITEETRRAINLDWEAKLKAEADAKAIEDARLKAEQESADAAATGKVGTGTGGTSVTSPVSTSSSDNAATDATSGVGVGDTGPAAGGANVGKEGEQPSLKETETPKYEQENTKQNLMLRLQNLRDDINKQKTDRAWEISSAVSSDLLKKQATLLDDVFNAMDGFKPRSKVNEALIGKVKELETRLEELKKPIIKQESLITTERKALEAQEIKSQKLAAERDEAERVAEESPMGKGATNTGVIEALLAGDMNAAISRIRESGKGLNLTKLEDSLDKSYFSGVGSLFRITNRGGRRAVPGFMKPLVMERVKNSQIIFKEIANILSGVDFSKSKIVVGDIDSAVFERLKKENKLAEYDPRTDTFYFTLKGLDEATVLHEAVHAATVKIIRQFEIDPAKLTQAQRDAVEHLHKIFDSAKKKLGGKYKLSSYKDKFAFENIYEFVSYALTDLRFQADLAEIRTPGLAKYTKAVKDLWSQFTQALMNLLGLTKPTETKLEIRPELYKALTKAFGDSSSYVPTERNVTKRMVEDLNTDQKKDKFNYETARDDVFLIREATSNLANKYPDAYPNTDDELGDLKTFADAALNNSELNSDITRITKKKAKFQRGLSMEQGYEGNLMLETAEIFKEILSTPEAGVDVEPLAATAQGKKPQGKKPIVKEMKIAKDLTPEEVDALNKKDIKDKYVKKNLIQRATDIFFTPEGRSSIVKNFQNDREPLKKLNRALQLSNKLITDPDQSFNNLYDLISLSAGNAFHAMTEHVGAAMKDVDKALAAYAKAANLEIVDALAELHSYVMALHEPERRMSKYIRTVPLSQKNILTVAGVRGKISPADYRTLIYARLDQNKNLVSTGEAVKLRTQLDTLVEKYKDPLGYSPNGYKETKLDALEYNVIGEYTSDTIKRIQQKFKDRHPAELKALMDAIGRVQEGTTYLDKQANYWSQQVDNRVAFYGYKHYVPFKGKPDPNSKEEVDYDNPRSLSKEFVEGAYAFEGRASNSENPILQTLADAAKASMRAGRKGVTQAIKNLINQKFINGKLAKNGTIKFEDRYNTDWKTFQGPNKIFHYMPDGTIEIYEIHDPHIREAIRRTYQDTNAYIQLANNLTSGIGQMHTRYNIAFAPMNFIRDALTNAFTMGAEMGPKATFNYLGAIASKVSEMGLTKAGKVSYLYANNKIDEIKKMMVKSDGTIDSSVRDILEYLESGGRVSYIQGIAVKGQFDELVKDVGRSKLIRSKEQLDKWVDLWTDSFELTSRSAAYGIAKQNALDRGVSLEAAKIEATAYAKNLANFEQVGTFGKEAGAAFMFFRPAATGAVRALDALAPMWENVDNLILRLPPTIRDDPAAVKAFKENHAKLKSHAKVMSAGLLGAGATIYLMALMMAGDDEQGRNRISTDDMARWTRYLRLPIPGSDQFLQIPWGFGLGAFAAAGAQIMGAVAGKTSIGDMAANMVGIALDSYIPLPVSRMNVLDNPLAWLIDSSLPSVARPFVEYVMNVDSLGRSIYNNRQSRYGDAYTGGDNIPEIYKSVTRMLVDSTGGKVDWSPNTLYFFANNYVDGASRLAQNVVDISMSLAGTKDFDPKTNLMVLDSFIGRKSNFDAREFASVENKIKEKEKILKMFLAENPEQYVKYIESNPMDATVVYIYNKQNATLNKINETANTIRRMPDMTPKERKEILENVKLTQNYIKRGMIETYKQFDVTP